MRVCVVGSGGREHALSAGLRRDGDEVVVTPGNPGIPGSVNISPEQVDADLFVVGPEVPLVDGLADRLRSQGRLVLGPGADGAQLEGSKRWMKELLVEAGVPTADYEAFTADQQNEALAYLDTMNGMYVIKTDGLAAGKGVVVTASIDEARQTVREYLSGAAHGDAGRTIIIEHGMTGPELSLFALCDGTRAAAFGSAQDYKRVGDGDTGRNTGGMGAFSPVAAATETLTDQIMGTCVNPTLRALQARGIDYRGFLFCGLMLTPEGPKVVEYNIRFGDPEAQVVFPRLRSSASRLFAQAAAGNLEDTPEFTTDAAVCVVLAAERYPGPPRTGDVITGLSEAAALPGVSVFCAGVTAAGGRLVTAGGRVVNVVGTGPDLSAARECAYQAVDLVSWDGEHHRSDIAVVHR